MSTLHDFAPLLSPAPPTDHFASSFLQSYHHHPSSAPSGHASLVAAAASYDAERYLAAPYVRAPVPPAFPSQHHTTTPFDYPSSFHNHHHHHQSQSALSLPQHPHHPAPSAAAHALRGFDPRPPHAGWTPKEEDVDDDQSTHLLTPRPPLRVSPHLGLPIDVANEHSPTAASKTYSFVSLPGNAIRKRPRRRYDEIERLYACAWPDCTKAYGTLNHLNAHVSMQRHGPKRSPAEFKELRKQWKQQKKQEAASVSASSSSPTTSTPSSTASGPITTPTSVGSCEPAHCGGADHPFGTLAGTAPAIATLRRRRGTEPCLVPPPPAVPNLHPRLSLGDLRYPHLHAHAHGLAHSAHQSLHHLQHQTQAEDPAAGPGPSPTSTSASDTFWGGQDSPISPPLQPLGRLPPDSTLLTPLPGYRAPTPPPSVSAGVAAALLHHHQPGARAHGHDAGGLLALSALTPSPPSHAGSSVGSTSSQEGSYEEYHERHT